MRIFLIALIVLNACSVTTDNTRDTYYVYNEGVQMPVVVKGPDTKRIILFIHGGPGGTSIPSSYSTAMQEITKEYRTVYYDQRGSGGAKGHIKESSITIPQFVRDLDAVIASIKARRPDAEIVLLGHSFGGLVSGAYAAVNSHKISGVAWVSPALNVVSVRHAASTNTIFHFQRVLQRSDLSKKHRNHLKDAITWYQQNLVIDMQGFIKHNDLVSPYYKIEGLKSSLGSILYLGSDPLISLTALPENTFSVIAALEKNNEDNRDLETDPIYTLSKISVPVVMFTGWKDIIVPADSSKASFATLNPTIPKTLVEYTTGDVGHSAFIENPDQFVNDFKTFLTSF